MAARSALRVVLVDRNAALVNAWSKQLASVLKHSGEGTSTLSIETHQGTLSSLPDGKRDERTAIVSPANSIGGMGGGFDEALSDLYASQGTSSLQRTVESVELFVRRNLRHGYTPLGVSHVVEFYNYPDFQKSKAWLNLRANSLVVLPTMRVPRSIYDVERNDSVDVKRRKDMNVVRFIFDCVWEVLSATSRHNEKFGWNAEDDEIQGRIDKVVIPGLGTGYGHLPTDLVAKGMMGALTLWGLCLPETQRDVIYKGVLCLAFLGEDYTTFENPQFDKMFTKRAKFDILDNDVGDFLKVIV